jgi:hypothetical protein
MQVYVKQIRFARGASYDVVFPNFLCERLTHVTSKPALSCFSIVEMALSDYGQEE